MTWRDQNTEAVQTASVLVQRPPSWTYYRSLVWFLQEMLIFAIGARVFWKRPDDESAQLFFAVCIVTVGAFMGGYHWTEIVTEPGLIYPFALFAVLRAGGESALFSGLPATESGDGAAQAAGASGALTESTTAYLIALWGSMFAARWFSLHHGSSETKAAFLVLRILAEGYIALAAFLYGFCIYCVIFSYRNAQHPRRAQPGALDHVGLARGRGVDRPSAGAGRH